ncbi:MAG: VanZ family protein [Deltaproteobacteria bacterium]
MLQTIFIAYTLFVIVLSLLPLPSAGTAIYKDKIVHFLMYGLMALLAYISVPSEGKRKHLLAFIIILGAAIELIQIYIPGRSASLMDIFANTGGVVFVIFLFWIYSRFFVRRVEGSGN